MNGVIGIIAGMNLPSHNLPAVQIHDQIQVKPVPLYLRRQVGHIPAPHLAGAGGDVRAWPTRGLWRPGTSPVCCLSMRPQNTLKARFAGQIDPFIGQHRHNACRRQLGKPWFIDACQYLRTLLLAERMARCRTLGSGAFVADEQAAVRPPAL
ncbi:hypothetical protein FACS1894185_4850 [Betaproteobacteria bacterium]|nr:hypothetical protein FACS1894185_4850 [Betaproteobacteria bacterium]